MDKDPILSKVLRLKSESENNRSQHDARWQKNIKLNKGIPLQDKSTVSKVTNKSKIYFRKIWATVWRLAASFYAAFMRDPESFLVEGRDTYGDPSKAKFLQFMTKYRIDKMTRENNLFLKHIWAIQNMLTLGWAVGKLSWEYDPERGKDGPVYTLYPNEQVYPDLAAETSDQMRYVIFENYMSYDQMEEAGYENLESAQKEGMPSNQVRSARYQSTKDPFQNPGANEYPKPGTYEDENKDDVRRGVYRVWECFYRDKGVIKLCVTNAGNAVLRKEKDSPYGNKIFPLVMGVCLTEPHKMIGEGFPEPLEGPQESFNQTMNMRKDNVALALTSPTVVSRYGNVDLNALVNRSTGKVIMADDVNQVKQMDVQDVTRMAHAESAADSAMMQDMSGVTPSHEGMGASDTATQTQVNLSQGNAKIELYLAIGGETYFRSFYSILVSMIQKFETDETIFRIANDEMQRMGYEMAEVSSVDDFDADITINVGMAYAGREQEIRQSLLVLDRGAVYNQTQVALLQTGAVPAEGVMLFNGAQVFRDLLPKMGKKEIDKYFVTIPPPQQAPGGGGGSGAEGMAGATTPQIGDMGAVVPQNEMQAGSMGGF